MFTISYLLNVNQKNYVKSILFAAHLFPLSKLYILHHCLSCSFGKMIGNLAFVEIKGIINKNDMISLGLFISLFGAYAFARLFVSV